MWIQIVFRRPNQCLKYDGSEEWFFFYLAVTIILDDLKIVVAQSFLASFANVGVFFCLSALNLVADDHIKL